MSAQLIDSFGRKIEYLRLSVTDRCNFRCFYCLPKGFKNFAVPEQWLTFDEIERIVKIFGKLGVHRIRITGGEPLMRKNLPNLIAKLHALSGIDDLSLSTNASQLSVYAEILKQAGISRINVSLDSLKSERFQQITQSSLDKVIEGLMVAKQVGLNPIKINMVIMKGINDDEVIDMVEFCLQHDFTLRMIETMPMGSMGNETHQYYVSLQIVKEKLAEHFTLIPSMMSAEGTARYVQIKDTNLRIGFITPLSQHFCETCNRVRLSTEGTLFLCLGQGDNIELRPLLRAGINDSELEQVIINAIFAKPAQHEFDKHFEKPLEKPLRFMSVTGG